MNFRRKTIKFDVENRKCKRLFTPIQSAPPSLKWELQTAEIKWDRWVLPRPCSKKGQQGTGKTQVGKTYPFKKKWRLQKTGKTRSGQNSTISIDCSTPILNQQTWSASNRFSVALPFYFLLVTPFFNKMHHVDSVLSAEWFFLDIWCCFCVWRLTNLPPKRCYFCPRNTLSPNDSGGEITTRTVGWSDEWTHHGS